MSLDWKSAAGEAGWVKVASGSQFYDDLQCWWGDQAAYDCEPTSTGFSVYGPPSSVSGQVQLKVATSRAKVAGLPGKDFVLPKEGDYQVGLGSQSQVVRLEPRVFSSLSQSTLVASS